ncbi:recombinase family protein [Arthrobacter sp. NPDC093128]|uniref:recombinase family protein n=1 Tax=Arthrobacter sp. NPDC093128 TaxID=3154979 RepID=UPI003449E3BD
MQTASTTSPELLRFARDGDTVVVHSMDRLAATSMTCALWSRDPHAKACGWSSSKMSLNFTGEDSPMANLMLSVRGAFAEVERSLIRERQGEGHRTG